MNRNVQILIGILVLIVLGAGAFLMFKNSSKAPVASQNSQTTVAEQKPAGSQKSINDLLTSGQAQKCTYKDKMAEVDVEGTVYVAGGKMRSDYTSKTGGQTIMGHMVVSDNKSYIWMDGQSMGMMMTFDPNKATEAAPTGAQSVDVNKLIDYNCSGWALDNSVFTPPSNVKFQNLGEVKTPTSSTGVKTTAAPQNQCAACDYLTGDDKTQCRTALKCN